MDPELKKLLEQNLKASEANHHILKKIRRAQKLEHVFKFLYWVVIIVVIFGGYVYIMQPLLQQVTGAYEGLLGTVETVQDTTSGIGDTVSDTTSFLGNLFGRNKAPSE